MQKEQANYETQLKQTMVAKAIQKPSIDLEKKTASSIKTIKESNHDDNYRRAEPSPTCCEILLLFLFCCCFCLRVSF